MIKCAQCGFENSLGRLHCSRCKSRLDLGRITREYFLNAGNHGHQQQKILQYILLAVIFCFTLALWPVRCDPAKSAAELGKARGKLAQLQEGVATSPIEFSEKEVNALFNHLLQETRRRPNLNARSLSMYAGQVVINPKTLTIYLNHQVGPWDCAPISIGPFWLTYKITGRPEKGPDGLRFVALSGGIGHLPLPVLGRNLGAMRLKQLFLPYKNARIFLRGLEIIEMKNGSITVFGAKLKQRKESKLETGT